jgi:iron complex outermembrane receptor protein
MVATKRLVGGARIAVAAVIAAGVTTAEGGVAAEENEALLFAEIPSVYGASRYEQPTTEAPAAVTILTAADIERFGWRTLGEALRSVPGFYTTYDRTYTYLGTRGFSRPGDYNSRLLFLLDGRRVNENIYDSAYYGFDGLVDLALVDRIEIIRGPASSVYGTSALLGLVHVVTKRGRDLAGFEAAIAGESYGTYEARGAWGARAASGIEALVSVGTRSSDGPDLYFPQFDDPATGNGRAVGLDGEERNSAFARLGWGDWALDAAYADREKDVPTGAYGTTFGDPRAGTSDRTLSAQLVFDRILSDASQVTLRAYGGEYRFEGRYPYDETLNVDRARGTWLGFEGQYERTFAEHHRLLMGVLYQSNLRQDQENFDVEPPALYLQVPTESSQWALFAQDEVELGADWSASAGVRLDHYETFGETLNPRISVIWGAARPSTIKLLYGRAFRAPNAYELYYADAVTTKSNLQLQPETIETIEGRFEHRFREHYRFGASAYRFRIDDLINQVEDPEDGLMVFQNLDRAEGTGVEVELAFAFSGGFEGRFGWAFQDAEDRATGSELSNAPDHLGNASLWAPIVGERLGAGVGVRYVGSRNTPSGGEVGSSTVVDLNLLAKRVVGGLDVSVSAFNLLDEGYADPVGPDVPGEIVVQDGRSFRLSLRYAF